MSITPWKPNVYTVDGHVIKCVMKDIPGPVTDDLQWTDTSDIAWEYGIENGDDTYSEYHQTSTLTFSTSDLESLKQSSASQTFSCKIASGKKKLISWASQQFTIYSPSEYFLKRIPWNSTGSSYREWLLNRLRVSALPVGT